jgi:N-acetylglucosaminyl-diphospho-decaprenol L-rhamnosyltransferase
MKYIADKVTVSIVSHNHGSMVWKLVRQMGNFEEINKIIVTLNMPESIPDDLTEKVLLIQNSKPKGFGENHNAAFDLIDSDFYCVLNPDIEFRENPFPKLIPFFENALCGVVAPAIIDSKGGIADTMRQNLTPIRLLKRFIGSSPRVDLSVDSNNCVMPDWIAGMFMLFRSEVFNQLDGFNQKYFMYCEDADICRRIWISGYQTIGCLSASVVHKGQYASHKNVKHFFWHCQSLLRYYLTYSSSPVDLKNN